MDLLHKELTDQILSAFYKVYNKLGYGFLEKVYENALLVELEKNGLFYTNQQPIKVYYDGICVGDYIADVVVDKLVIVELKATEQLRDEHTYQLINYLKATDIEVGLLLNFGRTPQFSRRAFLNRS